MKISLIIIFLGWILVLDQLWLFGIPFGPFLPDLSIYDITGSPLIHHWMLGVVLIITGLLIQRQRR